MKDTPGTAVALPDEDPVDAILEKLQIPAKDRERAAVIIEESFSQISHHSGPLPKPSDMAAYEAIQTGFAERIMRMAEKEQLDRHDSLNGHIEKEYSLKSRGQHYSMAAIVLLTAFAGWLAYLGDTKAAAWVVGAGLVGIVSVFVTGRLATDQGNEKTTNSKDD